MVPAQFRIDIFKEVERLVSQKHKFVTLEPVVAELERLDNKGIGKKVLKRVEVIPCRERNADNAIVNYARKGGIIVCTNDGVLRKRLEKEDVPTIYVRGKDKLEIKGYVG